MASGIKIQDDVVAVHAQMKTGKNLKYIILAMDDKNEFITVEEAAGLEKTADDLRTALQNANGLRYAMIDLHYEKIDKSTAQEIKQKRNRIVGLFWNPDNAGSIKQRMVYASSVGALTAKLEGLKFHQVNDRDDIKDDDLVALAENK